MSASTSSVTARGAMGALLHAGLLASTALVPLIAVHGPALGQSTGANGGTALDRVGGLSR
ncbi:MULTISPECIES: hypothetical protein [unclassified Beijerinckia]|uniref:hypothetical protein n=1 Tax=unclassified Beijerinckia TaxID=2638183 RepID=UPI000B89A121|nr:MULTISPECIES: hypothetical protein [unclassified Beijerinckia]